MSSRSSTSSSGPFAFGLVTGPRGPAGELTVRVLSGVASRWLGLESVWLRRSAEVGDGASFEVEGARSYGGRLVLKLRGVEDAGAAAALRGCLVLAPADAVPALPEGTHYVARLLGCEVVEEGVGRLGVVLDVRATGRGPDLLVIERPGGAELLVPMVRDLVLAIEESRRRIRVRLPEGLLDLEDARGDRP